MKIQLIEILTYLAVVILRLCMDYLEQFIVFLTIMYIHHNVTHHWLYMAQNEK
jgi:hypothetical protein